MIAAAALAAYVVTASLLGPRALLRPWAQRSPAAALCGWQALCVSVLLAAALVPLTLAVPYLPVDHVLAHLLRADALAVAGHYRGPLGLAPVLVAHLLVGAALVSLVVAAGRETVATARVRRRQRRALALVAEPQPDGHLVVPSPTPAVWCLPGRRPTVVVTSAAREALTPAELRAALLHERAHLRAHHAAAVALTRVLGRALPGLGLFAAARRETALLVELAADDAARRTEDRRALRRALVVLATGGHPAATLAASGTATLLRVQRLGAADEPSPTRWGVARLLAGLVAVVIVLVPLVVALAPALEASLHHCLPVEPRWLAR